MELTKNLVEINVKEEDIPSPDKCAKKELDLPSLNLLPKVHKRKTKPNQTGTMKTYSKEDPF